MTIFLLLLTHVLFIGWGVGMSQRMQQELPWWKRRFRVACLPHKDHIFWITPGPKGKGFTWERHEFNAATFAIWQIPSAIIKAMKLGARWKEIWLRWV